MNKTYLYCFSGLLSLSVLSGCNLTPTFNTDKEKNQYQAKNQTPEVIASPEEVVDALTIAALQLEVGELAKELKTPEFEDVWDRISYQLSINVPQNRQVVTERNWYAKHPSYIKRVSARASPFLHFIVEEIEKREMPIELALLPIVESAFDPFAYSHGRASGLWQFIPGTGNRFKLKQSWWYDGRRDVIAATRAALDYLSFLHKTLDGDWLNAIAAYNSGEGRVLRAIKRNRQKHLPTDFWSLDLPKETSAYVPKLLALADLLKRNDEFNLAWTKISNQPAIAVVDAKSQIDLAKAAELAEMDLEDLHHLNPGYNQWATDPNGPHKFILPIEKANAFEVALANLPNNKRMSWSRYIVKSGDTLGGIAQKFNTSLDVLRDVNKIKGRLIRVNQALLIPTSSIALTDYTLTAENRLVKKQNTKQASNKLTYIVQSGDTFWDISREYDVSIRSLAKWNGMAPKDPIKPGQKLVIWKDTVTKHQSENAVMRAITYRVRNGDSLARIAKKFKVKIVDIAKWNQLDTDKYLRVGQALKLYVDVTRT
ncbi:LysM peptidoglycan-binding domain-containing protein [Psychrosphaera sp. B3R10]|uniref:lytic transglycosylase n=1 Tax=unclassified Psychrosphaera TaxID=2641570 RepID=UPI001C07EFF2|nr:MULTISPECIES: LysM peptidoglycan-binding domain-containing protein [unclassified Psychrosphaera]MBU2882163.1 LysM peptidoglycan-binding domain-containing protein [Psychrosphaera sp. I2R16]MBU2988844.1 LysM peptidoglycan-binding domain-containing protein [Psychrosphaera sp. B3R10]MDO6717864.1 LysM peptidoglycan-binding domain-containing protein [Psychrosphaera sp. 1_MG-2023]